MSDKLIEAYVRTLARTLPGPRRLRAGLLDELADGLHDAATAYERAGIPPREAQARAVEECGDVNAVAPAFRTELAAAQGGRTAKVLALTLPGLVLLWDVPWLVGGSWVAPFPRTTEVLADIITTTGLLVGGCALLALVLLPRCARLRAPGAGKVPVGRVAGVLCGAGAAGLAITLGCSAAMILVNPDGSVGAFLASWLGLTVQSITVVAVAGVIRSLVRTFRTLRSLAAAPAKLVPS